MLESAIATLTELRDSLPVGHQERPGVIRAIEALRSSSGPSMSVAEVLVCTRCAMSAEDIASRPSFERGHPATVRVEDGRVSATPHKSDCPMLPESEAR